MGLIEVSAIVTGLRCFGSMDRPSKMVVITQWDKNAKLLLHKGQEVKRKRKEEAEDPRTPSKGSSQ